MKEFDEEAKERLLSALERAANTMRGMVLDPALPAIIKEALRSKVDEIDALVAEFV